MKFIPRKLFVSLMAMVILFASCNKDEDKDDDGEDDEATGVVQLMFDNKVGTDDLVIDDTTATSYRFSTASGEKFNVTRFGYYITDIVLEGPNGEQHIDPVKSSANADEVSGYYQVLEGNSASNPMLISVPVGTYNKVRFTVGIPESGVQEGAQGGVLDVASGAWFWSWNAGYIGWLLEGQAENSTGTWPATNGYALHVGGWKDVTPAEGDPVKFSDNTRIITIDFDENLTLTEGASPMIHLECDILKVLDGVSIDFATKNQLHSPAAGAPLANEFSNAFGFGHLHLSGHSH